jgi:hypothetical protein
MTEPSVPLTGTCNCGAVSFEVTEALVSATYCHCTRCQRRTGAGASASARTAPNSFRIVRGEDRIRSWKPADGAEKCFCGECGSALFSRNAEGAVGVRLGVLDSDPGIRPGARQFTGYGASWEAIPDDGLPRHAEAAPPRPTG